MRDHTGGVTRLADAVPPSTPVHVVTVGADGRPHVAPVTASVGDDGDVVVDAVGRRTRTNLDAGSPVTVVWSPARVGGYTLIVDGAGTATGARCLVRPQRAVLHRASGELPDRAAADGCGADCVPLDLD